MKEYNTSLTFKWPRKKKKGERGRKFDGADEAVLVCGDETFFFFCHHPSLGSSPPSLSSSAPPVFFQSTLPSLSLFLPPSLLSTLPVFSALRPVSPRIPLVAQLRDSAGKLRLFKARSAGKASSCLERKLPKPALVFTHFTRRRWRRGQNKTTKNPKKHV